MLLYFTAKNFTKAWTNNKKDNVIYVGRNSVAPSCNRCASGKAIYITYSECVFVVISIQLVMPRTIFYCQLWPACLHIFSTLFHKCHDFRKGKDIGYKRCVPIFSTTFIWSISLTKNKWTRYDQTWSLVEE